MYVRLTYPFASIGRNARIHYTWDFRKYLAHRVKLGSSIEIHRDVQFGVGGPHWEEKGEPVIIIDDRCIIARRSQISARNCVHLESDVILSPGVLIMDHDHVFEDIALPIRDQGISEGGRIRIGQGCWIGYGAAIICSRGELVLGRHCVVGANAVVTRSAPPYSVLSGNPARIVKQFDPVKQVWVLGSVRSAETVPTK